MVNAVSAELANEVIILRERKGYCRIGKAAGQASKGRMVLFKIPTGGKA